MNSYRSALNYAQSVEEAKGSQNLKPCGPGLSSGAAGLANRPGATWLNQRPLRLRIDPTILAGGKRCFAARRK